MSGRKLQIVGRFPGCYDVWSHQYFYLSPLAHLPDEAASCCEAKGPLLSSDLFRSSRFSLLVISIESTSTICQMFSSVIHQRPHMAYTTNQTSVDTILVLDADIL